MNMHTLFASRPNVVATRRARCERGFRTTNCTSRDIKNKFQFMLILILHTQAFLSILNPVDYRVWTVGYKQRRGFTRRRFETSTNSDSAETLKIGKSLLKDSFLTANSLRIQSINSDTVRTPVVQDRSRVTFFRVSSSQNMFYFQRF